MLHFNSDQLQTWIFDLLLPLIRVLGLIAIAPVFSHSATPKRIKFLVGLVITLIIMPTLPSQAPIEVLSFKGVGVVAKEFIIGLAMGFSMRIMFSAVELAGHMIAMSMGLGFATFFDPQTQGQSNAISQYLVILVVLIFLSLDGHLMMVATLSNSFMTMPINSEAHVNYLHLAQMGETIFSAGLLLSLPLVTTLLITNMALGILTKTAPQLNIFGIGFPITIFVGLLILIVSLPTMLKPVENLIESSLNSMTQVASP
jgi:flagellar biosynthesis protein FliR